MKRLSCQASLVASVILLMAAGKSLAQPKELNGNEILNGLSNHGMHLDKPYISPGDRTYIVGTQNGNFPDLGSHVRGEMGGLWMPPIKLLDGFWVRLTDVERDSSEWLKVAPEFINYPYGSKFLYPPLLDGMQVERLQYCPQGKPGMVIKYTLKNAGIKLRKLHLTFAVKTDISPVWFSKENNIIDAPDSIRWDADRSIYIARDVKNPWFALWGSSLPVISHAVHGVTPIETMGLGKSASTTYLVEIKPNESMMATFFVAGSNENMESAIANYDDVKKNEDQLLRNLKAHYASVVNRAKIEIPDKKLQEAYTWGKINTEWLVNDLQGIGRFLGAGAIEYPWLFGCDNSYALQGVVASGDHALAKSTLSVIKNVSEKANGNGRIIHEMSSNGFVYNKGNTQETAHFALAVWKVFEWTGDVNFLKEMYPYVKQGIRWLMTEQDQNHNMFPEGYGIMEVKGLNAELVDVAVYSQQALEAVSKMAGTLNEPAAEREYSQQAEILKNKVNTLFWDDAEGSYCDFYGSREQAIATTTGAIEQIQINAKAGITSPEKEKEQQVYEGLLRHLKTLPEGTAKGWLTNKNWVISTPMECGIAPVDKAISLLDKVRHTQTGDYGPYLSAVERTRMMTIATGVQAMAEAAYGRTDESMWYVDKIVQTFGRVLPGSISEMMPDYGCPAQAWTMYGLAMPLITHVFGLHPDAYHKTITFSPHLPSSWNEIKISALPVGNNIIALAIKKSGNSTTYDISSENADWKYTLTHKGLEKTKYILNGKTLTALSDEIEFSGKVNHIVIVKSPVGAILK